MRKIKPVHLLAIVCGLLLSLASTQQIYGDYETVHTRLLQSTGWINCPQPNGGNSWGTCWVYDRQQRLVITNKHVIDKALSVTIDFPMYEKGKLVTSITDYIKQVPIRGQVIAFDEK